MFSISNWINETFPNLGNSNLRYILIIFVIYALILFVYILFHASSKMFNFMYDNKADEIKSIIGEIRNMYNYGNSLKTVYNNLISLPSNPLGYKELYLEVYESKLFTIEPINSQKIGYANAIQRTFNGMREEFNRLSRFTKTMELKNEIEKRVNIINSLWESASKSKLLLKVQEMEKRAKVTLIEICKLLRTYHNKNLIYMWRIVNGQNILPEPEVEGSLLIIDSNIVGNEDNPNNIIRDYENKIQERKLKFKGNGYLFEGRRDINKLTAGELFNGEYRMDGIKDIGIPIVDNIVMNYRRIIDFFGENNYVNLSKYSRPNLPDDNVSSIKHNTVIDSLTIYLMYLRILTMAYNEYMATKNENNVKNILYNLKLIRERYSKFEIVLKPTNVKYKINFEIEMDETYAIRVTEGFMNYRGERLTGEEMHYMSNEWG